MELFLVESMVELNNMWYVNTRKEEMLVLNQNQAALLTFFLRQLLCIMIEQEHIDFLSVWNCSGYHIFGGFPGRKNLLRL